MSSPAGKPVIFISYSHKDEPEKPRDGEIQWLTFVLTYLQPAVKHGVYELWVDQHMPGGTDWDPEIEKKLRECDVFVLLVSPNSTASDYIVDKEIVIIRERQANGEAVHFYPLLLTPTPKAGLDKVNDKNLRPRGGKPFSGYSLNDRMQHMTDAANEIAELVEKIASRRSATLPTAAPVQPAYVHITGLPETAYERLVGRDAELKRLDEAWADGKINILSLIAEGGAGKSALVNEWLKRLQADNYRGAEAVLGWSFYSQGSKERATSAEEFLNWALEKLGLTLATTSATAKGEAIAEALAKRRVLLVLDGVEPLQHGLDRQQGELKDQGLRALLRRFAAMPPAAARSLVVLTSRLPVKDIARWKDGAAPVRNVEELLEEAGAALLRDNGVWGTDRELASAARDFGGHPLALGLLASFLTETQKGDVRRRDHIRAFFADRENPRHDHARRVMESYETEWLAGQPVAHAIMHMVGLFDRPASGECLRALRRAPAIDGLTGAVIALDESAWQRAVARLREVRLLAPDDPAAPDALDAHPLVREWFGERLKATNEQTWRAAHGRLYEYLRYSTKEGNTPTLEDLAPLYQAIAHGCRGGRHLEALSKVYKDRICRRGAPREIEFYASKKLGALGSNLAAISWFFETPYETPVTTLSEADRSWILGQAAVALRAQGRFSEALIAQRAALDMYEAAGNYVGAAIAACNLSGTELLVGRVAAALASAKRAVSYINRPEVNDWWESSRTAEADALHASGQRAEAQGVFRYAEQRQKKLQSKTPLLYSLQGYQYCELLLANGDWTLACDRATNTIEIARQNNWLLDVALDTLTLGRALLGQVMESIVRRQSQSNACNNACSAASRLEDAIEGLRTAGQSDRIPPGHLARAAFRRSVGDWGGAARDLDEVEEIAGPGPMRLHLCDMAIERARLAFAKIEGFAPLHGLDDDSPPKPVRPSEAERKSLHDEAARQLAIAAEYIEKCGYHRRDEELAELQAVLNGDRTFADLPPRV